MARIKVRKAWGLGCLGAMAIGLSGCVVGSSSYVETTGTPVSGATMGRLVAGQTTESQVLELLGAPTRSVDAEAGGKIYVWEYERIKRSSGHVIFVFGGSSVHEERQTAYVLMRNGVVQEYWLDSPKQPSHNPNYNGD